MNANGTSCTSCNTTERCLCRAKVTPKGTRKRRKSITEPTRWSLFPLAALPSVVAVLEHDARTNGIEHWRTISQARTTHADTAEAHLYAWLDGEKNDPQTNHSHLARVICSLLYLHTLELEGDFDYGKPLTKQPSIDVRAIARDFSRLHGLYATRQYARALIELIGTFALYKINPSPKYEAEVATAYRQTLNSLDQLSLLLLSACNRIDAKEEREGSLTSLFPRQHGFGP